MPDIIDITLKELMSKAKCSISLTINRYKDYYDTIETGIKDIKEDEGDIPDDIVEGMMRTGNIIEIRYYPRTPIGFVNIIHYDIDEAFKGLHESIDKEDFDASNNNI